MLVKEATGKINVRISLSYYIYINVILYISAIYLKYVCVPDNRFLKRIGSKPGEHNMSLFDSKSRPCARAQSKLNHTYVCKGVGICVSNYLCMRICIYMRMYINSRF